MDARTPVFLRLRILAAGALLSAALIGSVVLHVAAVAKGTEITLVAQGFDPRSLLTGHYAQVAYAITRPVLETTNLAPKPGWQPVWVSIVPEAGDWKATAVSGQKPNAPPADGHLVLAEARYETTGAVLQLRYGIERIYAQQKEAEAIANAVRAQPPEERHMQVVASLGTDGRLRLKAIIVEGKRTDFTWW